VNFDANSFSFSGFCGESSFILFLELIRFLTLCYLDMKAWGLFIFRFRSLDCLVRYDLGMGSNLMVEFDGFIDVFELISVSTASRVKVSFNFGVIFSWLLYPIFLLTVFLSSKGGSRVLFLFK
jgi:hypothetical protein